MGCGQTILAARASKQASKQALTDHFGQILSKFPARGEMFLLDYQVSLPQKA
jgi:hypothetical protein